MSEFLFKVITPSGVLYSNNVSSLTIRSSEGYLTILPSHFPLVTNIVNCIGHFYIDNKITNFFAGNGILQVREEEVNIIVSSFNLKEDIDIDRAKKALERAKSRLENNDPSIDKIRANESLVRAQCRIELWEEK